MENRYKQFLKKLAIGFLSGIIVQCIVFAPFSASAAVQGQELIVTGKITDEDGKDLPGVSVVVKGTSLGAITNADGTYTINVPDGSATLIFSFIGYVKQEVSVSSQSVINISMKIDNQLLDEVVVVAYGTQQKITLR
jgi:TonB-dependent starch-binding outer membrane protein SusC